MRAWLDAMMIQVLFACKQAAKDERGDTNFISILIVLGIVILLATFFITQKQKIVDQVEEIVGNFTIG